MPNFQYSKVYKLVNSVDEQIYIGSTCQTLTKRKYQHKKDSAKHPNQKVYAHPNRIGWENVRIILIEEVQAFNKDQLRAREQHYIDLLRPSLNRNSAIANCPHGRRQNKCKECHGSGICHHNKRKSECKECNPNHICFECNKNFNSKHYLTKHCRTAKHKKTCKNLFKEIFDHELLDSEIPIY